MIFSTSEKAWENFYVTETAAKTAAGSRSEFREATRLACFLPPHNFLQTPYNFEKCRLAQSWTASTFSSERRLSSDSERCLSEPNFLFLWLRINCLWRDHVGELAFIRFLRVSYHMGVFVRYPVTTLLADSKWPPKRHRKFRCEMAQS